ncbi:MAG: amidohydrolase family protein [Kofleriaceae bacterium]
MRLVTLVLFLSACSSKPAVTHIQFDRPPVEAPKPITVKRLFIAQGRNSGTIETTTTGDTVKIAVEIVQNGRGPKLQAMMRLDADGTITSLSAKGTHTMGTRVDESFSREGNAATWKSEEESGEREVKEPAFYLPLSAVYGTEGLLVRAALKRGGKIALLPQGEARVSKIGEAKITAGSETRTVHGYRIDGIDLTPQFTWMNPDGTWFGEASEWSSVVPEGWAAAVAPLVAKRKEVERAEDAKLAAAQAQKPPAAGLAYTHARVLDVERGKWLLDHTVVIVGDKITAVGPRVTIPKGAEVVDLGGRAIVPGLIDMHVHLGGADPVLNIASGVTTVRDVGNDPQEIEDYQQRFTAGTAIGPHLITFGFIEGRGPKAAASKITAMTPEEAKTAVEYYAQRKYAGIKIYNSIPPELVPVLAKLAHDKGMKVIGHIPAFMLAHEAVKAGYDGIEHINMLFLNFFATKETDTRDTTRFKLVGDKAAGFDLDSKPMKDFIALLRQKQTVIDPTLAAFEDLLSGEPGKITPGLEATVARLPIQVQRGFLLNGLPVTPEQRTTYRASYDQLLALTKLLHDSKVRVVLGTDHIGGIMFHHEMALFARAGFSNATVLQLSTIGAARVLGLDKQIGSIKAGKRADLVVIDGDPLADIAQIGAIVSTMRAGVVFASQPLYESVSVKPYRRIAAPAKR